MSLLKLDSFKFIKNIDDPNRWAYEEDAWQIGQEVELNWSNTKGSETNAAKANQGDLILLVQKPPVSEHTLVTHLVQVTSAEAERKDEGEWGIVRKVKVIWRAIPNDIASAPKDQDLFGWKRHRAQGTNMGLIENIKSGHVLHLWHSLDIFRLHAIGLLGLTAQFDLDNDPK